MKTQVVLTVGERVWSSIRDTEAAALLRVTDFMLVDHDVHVKDAARQARLILLFEGFSVAKTALEQKGFTVESKQI